MYTEIFSWLLCWFAWNKPFEAVSLNRKNISFDEVIIAEKEMWQVDL